MKIDYDIFVPNVLPFFVCLFTTPTFVDRLSDTCWVRNSVET